MIYSRINLFRRWIIVHLGRRRRRWPIGSSVIERRFVNIADSNSGWSHPHGLFLFVYLLLFCLQISLGKTHTQWESFDPPEAIYTSRIRNENTFCLLQHMFLQCNKSRTTKCVIILTVLLLLLRMGGYVINEWERERGCKLCGCRHGREHDPLWWRMEVKTHVGLLVGRYVLPGLSSWVNHHRVSRSM